MEGGSQERTIRAFGVLLATAAAIGGALYAAGNWHRFSCDDEAELKLVRDDGSSAPWSLPKGNYELRFDSLSHAGRCLFDAPLTSLACTGRDTAVLSNARGIIAFRTFDTGRPLRVQMSLNGAPLADRWLKSLRASKHAAGCRRSLFELPLPPLAAGAP